MSSPSNMQINCQGIFTLPWTMFIVVETRALCCSLTASMAPFPELGSSQSPLPWIKTTHQPNFLKVNREKYTEKWKFFTWMWEKAGWWQWHDGLHLIAVLLRLASVYIFTLSFRHSKVLLESAYDLTRNLCKQYITRNV